MIKFSWCEVAKILWILMNVFSENSIIFQEFKKQKSSLQKLGCEWHGKSTFGLRQKVARKRCRWTTRGQAPIDWLIISLLFFGLHVSLLILQLRQAFWFIALQYSAVHVQSSFERRIIFLFDFEIVDSWNYYNYCD